MDKIVTPSQTASAESKFRVTKLFHPRHDVVDLAESEEFFERVFGRKSRRIAELFANRPASFNYPRDYSTWTMLGDVLFTSLDPKRLIIEGIQRYRTVDVPHLMDITWSVDDMTEAFRTLRRNGIGMVSQLDRVAEGDEPPLTAGSSTVPLFFTIPEYSGLRYEFLQESPFPLDPRSDPDWTLPPVADDDPLGLEFCSHHTILTEQVDRALRFTVDAMGGTVIHEGRDEAVGATFTYVRLADAVLAYGRPDDGTPAFADWLTTYPDDSYHSLTFKVVDLDRVASHLKSVGVAIRIGTEDTIITDAAATLGVPWAFTTKLVPGDLRGSR